MRNIADEYGPAGVRANAVRPGFTATELMEVVPRDGAIFQSYLDNTPLPGCGEPEDVGKLVRFLASDDARWITGQCIDVDGGHHLRRGPDYSRVRGRHRRQPDVRPRHEQRVQPGPRQRDDRRRHPGPRGAGLARPPDHLRPAGRAQPAAGVVPARAGSGGPQGARRSWVGTSPARTTSRSTCTTATSTSRGCSARSRAGPSRSTSTTATSRTSWSTCSSTRRRGRSIYHATFAPKLAAIRDRLPDLRVLLQVDDGSGNAAARPGRSTTRRRSPRARRSCSTSGTRRTTSTCSTRAARPGCRRACCGGTTTSS